MVFDKISDSVYTISKVIELCGYIKDSVSQNALTGATVTSGFAYAITDENGYFEIELRTKNQLVTIRHIGFKTIERQVKYFSLENCGTISMLVQNEAIAPIIIETFQLVYNS